MSTTLFSVLWATHYRLGWEDAQNGRLARKERDLPRPDFIVAYIAGREDSEEQRS